MQIYLTSVNKKMDCLLVKTMNCYRVLQLLLRKYNAIITFFNSFSNANMCNTTKDL